MGSYFTKVGRVIFSCIRYFLLGATLTLGLSACGNNVFINSITGLAKIQPISSEVNVGVALQELPNFRVFPGERSMVLIWDNPMLEIDSFNIIVYDLNNSGSLVTLPRNGEENSSSGVTTKLGESGVRYTIGNTNGSADSPLINNHGYRVLVNVNLKNSTGISVVGDIGSVDYPIFVGSNADNDEHADIVDACLNTLSSYISDPNLADHDRDGCYGDEDQLPHDPDEWDDIDGDGVGDNSDIDNDGDGLIEISSAAELDMIRNHLDGFGMSHFLGQKAVSSGCKVVNATLDICLGYELINNISLQNYPNWQPIGSCTGVDEMGLATCDADSIFSAIFEGNNYNIEEVHINSTGNYNFGVGLFGAISSTAVLRNLHLRQVNIARDRGAVSWFVGGLVGVVDGGSIYNTSVVDGSILGSHDVGGLVGGLIGSTTNNASIANSRTELSMVEGLQQNIGGLVGRSSKCVITQSGASVQRILGFAEPGANIGGLVGRLTDCRVNNGYAQTAYIKSVNQYAGGLVGVADNSDLTASFAWTSVLTTDSHGLGGLGGLIGLAIDSNIHTSYGLSSYIVGNVAANFFIGLVEGANVIGFSYAKNLNLATQGGQISHRFVGTAAQANTTLLNSYVVALDVTGLWAGHSEPNIIDSYWDSSFSSATADATDATARTTAELQNPTTFSGDYLGWGDGWCDRQTGEFTTDYNIAQQGGYANNTAWYLGENDKQPATNCFGFMNADEALNLFGNTFP